MTAQVPEPPLGDTPPPEPHPRPGRPVTPPPQPQPENDVPGNPPSPAPDVEFPEPPMR